MSSSGSGSTKLLDGSWMSLLNDQKLLIIVRKRVSEMSGEHQGNFRRRYHPKIAFFSIAKYIVKCDAKVIS